MLVQLESETADLVALEGMFPEDRIENGERVADLVDGLRGWDEELGGGVRRGGG